MFIPEPVHDSIPDEVDGDRNGTGATATRSMTRRKEFWYHDGSVVLRASNTLFKVHQTVLAAHSEVFADLFTLPQPESSCCEEVVEGCHIVRLYDSVQDLADLLRAIYVPSYVLSASSISSEINHEALSSHFDALLAGDPDLGTMLTFITGILRLSTKYAVHTLRQRCISILHLKFPTTLQHYSSISSMSKAHYRSEAVMKAITLARETNVPTLLPYAYYCVARMSLSRILKHTASDISWEEKTACMVGRERLRFVQTSLSHSFLYAFTPSPSCSTNFCARAHGPRVEWQMVEAAKAPHPLKVYERWGWMNVCEECVRVSREMHLKGREEVWECLPMLFGLRTWAELRKEESR